MKATAVFGQDGLGYDVVTYYNPQISMDQHNYVYFLLTFYVQWRSEWDWLHRVTEGLRHWPLVAVTWEMRTFFVIIGAENAWRTHILLSTFWPKVWHSQLYSQPIGQNRSRALTERQLGGVGGIIAEQYVFATGIYWIMSGWHTWTSASNRNLTDKFYYLMCT